MQATCSKYFYVLETWYVFNIDETSFSRKRRPQRRKKKGGGGGGGGGNLSIGTSHQALNMVSKWPSPKYIAIFLLAGIALRFCALPAQIPPESAGYFLASLIIKSSWYISFLWVICHQICLIGHRKELGLIDELSGSPAHPCPRCAGFDSLGNRLAFCSRDILLCVAETVLLFQLMRWISSPLWDMLSIDREDKEAWAPSAYLGASILGTISGSYIILYDLPYTLWRGAIQAMWNAYEARSRVGQCGHCG